MKAAEAAMAKLAFAKRALCSRQKFLQTIVYSLTDIPTSDVPMMAVDHKWRLAYNPEWVAEQTEQMLGCVVFHECLHLWLRHHKRAGVLQLEPGSIEWRAANYAMDCVIYERLVESGETPPDFHVKPETYGFDSGLSWEEYLPMFVELFKRQQEEQQQDGGPGEEEQQGDSEPQDGSDDSSESGQGEDNESDADAEGQDGGESDSDSDSDNGSESDENGQDDAGGDSTDGADESGSPSGSEAGESGGEELSEFGGSCADGVPRPWEPKDNDAEAPQGMSEAQQERAIRKAGEQLLNDRGEGSGGALVDVARKMLRPKADPRRVLAGILGTAITQVRGDGDWSYRRPSRRTDWSSKVVKPSLWEDCPNLVILVDTSGSMSQTDLQKAMGMIARICESFSLEGVKIVCGDTTIGMSEYVRDPRKIQFVGGGGTDMGEMIVQALRDEKRKPDAIVCITDGETPWCNREAVGKVPVCVVLTREERWGSHYKVPEWMRKVVI